MCTVRNRTLATGLPSVQLGKDCHVDLNGQGTAFPMEPSECDGPLGDDEPSHGVLSVGDEQTSVMRRAQWPLEGGLSRNEGGHMCSEGWEL